MLNQKNLEIEVNGIEYYYDDIITFNRCEQKGKKFIKIVEDEDSLNCKK